MDFIKDNLSKAQQQSGEKKEGSSGSSGSSEGKYDKYIDQGVQYAEKNFLHSDTSAENIKKRDEKIGDFISKQVDSYSKKQ